MGINPVQTRWGFRGGGGGGVLTLFILGGVFAPRPPPPPPNPLIFTVQNFKTAQSLNLATFLKVVVETF